MSDDTPLRDAARRAILAGTLPQDQWSHLWGQPGDDTSCAVCDLPLRPDQLAVGVQFTPDHPVDAVVIRVHLPCFGAWDQERQRFESM